MNPLLSVIIPMYGVERFIANCLDSICAQTYRNLEIICVNDGTKDRSAEIAEEYAKKDARISVVHNAQNYGLFRARVEGVKVAKGDYIAFVDADDFVAIDWFRLMVAKITAENADIVIGNDVSVNEKNERYYHNNYRYLTQTGEVLEGDDVLDAFYRRGGGCYAWHVVWNKVYSAALMKRCLPYLEMVDFHLIMLEDVAFSSVFYTHARKLCFADADCYFYYRHGEASTSVKLPVEKLKKNILDVGKSFAFVERALKSYDPEKFERYQDDIQQLKQRYRRIWNRVVEDGRCADDPMLQDALKETFAQDEPMMPLSSDFYFYDVGTIWDERGEELKRLVFETRREKPIEVVSFDMFDTLILRPLYNPEDLWCFVGRFAHTLFPFIGEDSFVKMRREAEAWARSRSDKQDITLTEIYEAFSTLYRLPTETVMQIRDNECQTEIEFCTPRKFVKEIFDLAKLSGKRVIVTSNMYLERDTIECMLRKCGYSDYDALFLSSERGVLKDTGDLYRCAAEELGVSLNRILHIGDSMPIDVEAARKTGLQAYHVPKASAVFENKVEGCYAGNSFRPFAHPLSYLSNTAVATSQLPMRAALAVIANHSFDNPFRSFYATSNYNGDPHYMGYYPLGLYLLGMAEWLYETAQKEGYRKIVFLARDGKMIREAFDMLCRVRGAKIESEYFYATRKALMPYSIKTPEDFYNINRFMGVHRLAPRRILEMFGEILNPIDADAEAAYAARGVDLDGKLDGVDAYYRFINALLEISYSEERRGAAWAVASDAFSRIFDEHTATFDMGYSGRLQSIICDLVGHGVDAFFDYSNGYNTDIVAEGRFRVHVFHDYTPTMASITREFFISDPAPSCSGYRFCDGKVIPVIEVEKDDFSVEATASIREMQRAALAFCRDYWEIYGALGSTFTARWTEYSVAFDFFLLNATPMDRATFRCAMEDDEVYGGCDAMSISEVWGAYMQDNREHLGGFEGMDYLQASGEGDVVVVAGVGKLRRAIVYLLADRNVLKIKARRKLEGHRILYRICKFFYAIPRGIYHLFKRKK